MSQSATESSRRSFSLKARTDASSSPRAARGAAAVAFDTSANRA